MAGSTHARAHALPYVALHVQRNLVTPGRATRGLTTANMASLTKWEEEQLDNIDLLLEQAEETLGVFKDIKEKLLRSGGHVDRASKDWLKFRSIALDMYSVLDYTFYLLHCHFSTKGWPDNSRNATRCGFPYNAAGIKISESPHHDQQTKFLKQKLPLLWGEGKFGEESHFWKEIGKVILEVQPKVEVDGAEVGGNEPQVSPGAEESMALLHFYRNCCTHRDLIRFVPEKSRVEINQMTRETRLVPTKENAQDQDRDGFFYYELEQGYWIALPAHVGRENESRLVMDVLQQLKEFVIRTANKLLFFSLLPQLKSGQASLRLQPPDLKPFPPTPSLQDYRTLTHHYEQRIKNAGFTVERKVEIKEVRDKAQQHFEAHLDISINLTDGRQVLHLSSHEHEHKGKRGAEMAAVEEVVEECIRLGLIQLC